MPFDPNASRNLHMSVVDLCSKVFENTALYPFLSALLSGRRSVISLVACVTQSLLYVILAPIFLTVNWLRGDEMSSSA